MIGFNFGQISDKLASFMDTDYVDIKRNVGNQLQTIYSNVPCHVSYSLTDNPDINSVDINPIIQKIIINFDNSVDVQNYDYLVVKKMSHSNNVIALFSGRCGNPIVSQCRKKVLMIMSATESELPTPPPPEKQVIVTIRFVSEGVSITPDINEIAELGKPFKYKIPELLGYVPIEYSINDEIFNNDIIQVDEIEDIEYLVEIKYDKVELFEYFRILVNGLFTKDNGALSNGYHLLRRTRILQYEEIQEGYIITCKDVSFEHGDNGKIIDLSLGTILVIYPNEEFVRIIKKEVLKEKLKVTCVPYLPTDEEREAVITGWYDES